MSAAARRSLLDEHRRAGTAAERFQTDRAGAGKDIEHPRIRHTRRDDVEERLAQLVGGWPQPVPARRVQAAALLRCRAMMSHQTDRDQARHCRCHTACT